MHIGFYEIVLVLLLVHRPREYFRLNSTDFRYSRTSTRDEDDNYKSEIETVQANSFNAALINFPIAIFWGHFCSAGE